MKQTYRLKSIGHVQVVEENTITIFVDRDYCPALKYLDEFSHIHLFFTEETAGTKRLCHEVAKLLEANPKTGKVLLEGKTETRLGAGAEVMDLKPYFPSEDTVRDPRTGDASTWRRTLSLEDDTYLLEAVGEIRVCNGLKYVQLTEAVTINTSHIKVFWWFNKFDKEMFRKATTCNPPYENAPKTGIFATRSPVRPNPIAMTIVRVLKQEGTRIYVSDIESFDHTPCIGIESYHPEEDRVIDCRVPRWLAHWPKFLEERTVEETRETTVQDSVLEDFLGELRKEDEREDIGERKCSVKKEQGDACEKALVSDQERFQGIVVQGARENNLKGISVRIPYRQITAVVGVSGSGKSSLVKDTVYAECFRRMEQLTQGAHAGKPKVDEMTGCIPAVVISQDAIRGNAFSTVGTYTDAYDYLRGIYARLGVRHCPKCGEEIIPLSKEQIKTILRRRGGKIRPFARKGERGASKIVWTDCAMGTEVVDRVLTDGEGALIAKLAEGRELLLQTKQMCYRCEKLMFEMTPATFSYLDADSRCQVCNGTGEVTGVDPEKVIEHPEKSLLEGACSFYGKLRSFLENPNANWMKGQIFGLATAMEVDLEEPWCELPEDFRQAVLWGTEEEVTFQYENRRNGRKGEITRPVEGICKIIERVQNENTESHKMHHLLRRTVCEACQGERLDRAGRFVTLRKVRFPEAAAMSFDQMQEFCIMLQKTLRKQELPMVQAALEALIEIAGCAKRLGIGYLRMNQGTSTLSGGEGRRLKLLAAFRNHISGILYIFDEPSKGLHPSDYQNVMDLLYAMKNEGNTILMVEHNEDMIRIADNVIEIGPGAGERGGMLVGQGTLAAMLQQEGTQICKYMGAVMRDTETRKEKSESRTETTIGTNEISRLIQMKGLSCHNLKNVDIAFPEGAMTCVCGLSGSGKSSLMKGEVYPRALQDKHFERVVLVDQQPIGKTSKSIVATYVGVMDEIRSAFAGSETAAIVGWDESCFSFNNPSGQCALCKGEGRVKLKFLEEAYVECPDCRGKRYKREILEVKHKGLNIAEVLGLSVEEAVQYCDEMDKVTPILSSLKRVGLGYLKLGQGTATLSGGEASRLKLSRELLTGKGGKTLFLLDEPTTGLHFSDVEHLLRLMDELLAGGNTIMAIEHNKQFIEHAHWKIEMGPGAGDNGGNVVYCGVF